MLCGDLMAGFGAALWLAIGADWAWAAAIPRYADYNGDRLCRYRRDPLAVKLLKQDHREVEGWFDEYEQLDADKEKLALFNKIALALKVHTKIEEEIFYADERGEVEDDMLDEALVEHDGAKKMIAEIEAMKPGEDLYDAKVKVLGEYIKHHVKEEEQPGGIFAQAKRGEPDLDAMGERLKARKAELMAEMSGGKSH
jgi:hypothetical protein